MTAPTTTLIEHERWLPLGKRGAVCFSIDDSTRQAPATTSTPAATSARGRSGAWSGCSSAISALGSPFSSHPTGGCGASFRTMLDRLAYCDYLERIWRDLDRRDGDALWWTSL